MNESSNTQFADDFHETIRFSREAALELGCDYIGSQHLLLGMIRNTQGKASRILRTLAGDEMNLRKELEDSVRVEGVETPLQMGNVPLTTQAESAVKSSRDEARNFQSNVIDTGYLLLSLVHDRDAEAITILDRYNVTYETVHAEIEGMK